MVLRWSKGVTERQEAFWEAVLYGDRSDTGGGSLPDDIQHRSGCSVKGGSIGSMWTPRGTARDWLVGRIAQNLLLCG